jgi:hypothetical protein
MSSGSKNGTQIYYPFHSKSPSKRIPSRFSSEAPMERETLARPTFMMHTEDVGCLFLTTQDFSFRPLCWKLETILAACSIVVKSSFLNSPFTRLWMLRFWRSLQHRLVPPHRHLGPDSSLCGMPTVPLSFSAQYGMLVHSSSDADNYCSHEPWKCVRFNNSSHCRTRKAELTYDVELAIKFLTQWKILSQTAASRCDLTFQELTLPLPSGCAGGLVEPNSVLKKSTWMW